MTTDTTLTTPVIAPEAAAARLRLRGFLVRPHGIKWLVLQDGHPRRLTLSPGDLSLAAQIAQAAADRLSMDALAEQLYAETGESVPGTGRSTDPPNGWGYQALLIRQIRRDGGTQARIGNNEETVQEYADLMREKRWNFQTMQRPIVLYDGTDFWLADGFHRIEAAQRAGMTDYPVEVLRGTRRDAVLRAAGANATHGLRRTNADKRRAVELLLKDAEWRQWSDRKIADTCAVDHKTVADVRKSLGGEVPHLTTRQGTDGKSYPAAPPAQKPPTCIRCGKGREGSRQLTSYQEGLVPEYGGKQVTLCSTCIPELLRLRKQSEQPHVAPVAAADAIPHLPPDFSNAQKRASAIGLHIIMDMNGMFSIKNAGGSGVDQIAEWESLLRHLAYSEQAATEIAAERSARHPGITLSLDLQKRLVSVGASIGGDGTVYAPRGSGESPAIMDANAAEAALERWAAQAQAPGPTEAQRASDDVKRQMIELLNRIAPLIKHITTDDFEGMSQAITDLNECEEGTEIEHWLKVGYAFCDVEP